MIMHFVSHEHHCPQTYEHPPRTTVGLRLLLVVSFAFCILMNILAGSGAFHHHWHHVTTGDVSDMHPTYMTPEHYAFGIWILIFIALGLFVLYHALSHVAICHLRPAVVHAFAWCMIATGFWTLAFIHEIMWLASLIIIVILLTAGFIYSEFVPWCSSAFPGFDTHYMTRIMPFSLLLGWVTFATLVMLEVFLLDINVGTSHDGQMMSCAVLLCLACVIALVILFTSEDIVFAAVITWALFAVRAAHYEHTVALTAAVCGGVVVAGIVIAMFRFLLTRATGYHKHSHSIEDPRLHSPLH